MGVTLTRDVSAHSTLWHSYTYDHRGQLVADVISNSDHVAGVPDTTLQQTSSPNVTAVSDTLYGRTSWTAQHALSSDHLPIVTTVNIRHDYRLQQNRRTFTNYRKADWTQFAEDTRFRSDHHTHHIHTANRVFTGIILMADRHTIPKSEMHSDCRILPGRMVCKITQGDGMGGADACGPALKILGEEITSDIEKHRKTLWKEHLNAHWYRGHSVHILWMSMHGLSSRTLNISITFGTKIATTPKHIANCFTRRFAHCQTRGTQDRQIH